ncbi:YdbL family protein [soil metagenome]
MTRKFAIIAAALFFSAGTAGVAYAQAAGVTAALSAGTVSEQADGYLGVTGAVSAEVKAEVEAINIKRRAAYTSLAAQRGVTVKDVAAAVGCTTLKKRGADLPAYCAK